MSRRIGIASLIWGTSILLSRLIGLVREAVIGRVLGGGSEADVYWTAFVVPDFLNHLLAGGALSLVFIPIFGGYLARGEVERGWHAFSVLANFLLSAMVVLLTGLWFALPALVPIIAPGFDDAQAAELVALSRIVLPAQIFHLLGGLLSATLQAQDRHALPALAPLLYTGSIVVGGWLGGPELGAYGFAWGVVVGSALGPFGMPLWGLLRTGIGWRPAFSLRHPDLRTYLLRSLPIMLGFSIILFDDWILRRQGSLLPAGAISTLQYAKTLMKVPMGVFGLATGVAAFPTLARLFAQNRSSELYGTLAAAVRRMLVPAFGAQVALTCAGAEIAVVIYGPKLPATQHEAIGVALGILSVGLWAWASQTVLARGFYATGNTWLPTVVGTGVTAACFPLYAVMGDRFGTAGLALASSVAISIYAVVLVALLRRRFPGVQDGLASFGARAAVAVAVGIGAGLLLRQSLPPLPPLLRGAALASFGGLVYAAAIVMLRVAEAQQLAAWLVGRVGSLRARLGSGPRRS